MASIIGFKSLLSDGLVPHHVLRHLVHHFEVRVHQFVVEFQLLLSQLMVVRVNLAN